MCQCFDTIDWTLQAFGAMLRYLDSQVGRPMSLTRAENLHKEPDDIITYVIADVSLYVCLSVCLSTSWSVWLSVSVTVVCIKSASNIQVVSWKHCLCNDLCCVEHYARPSSYCSCYFNCPCVQCVVDLLVESVSRRLICSECVLVRCRGCYQTKCHHKT